MFTYKIFSFFEGKPKNYKRANVYINYLAHVTYATIQTLGGNC